jgi:predicted transcriptional regulator
MQRRKANVGRRSNIEVIADMLRLGEAGKTEIMYSANMSYFQLQKYLAFLMQRGFIEKV